ncbi:hypothetical protein, partial [Sinorhizobium meliloti]|uniref:hypothetical protein n=1 Tax=Rhizobium meliloti TaxID=382 RepID=UPI001AECB2D2
GRKPASSFSETTVANVRQDQGGQFVISHFQELVFSDQVSALSSEPPDFVAGRAEDFRAEGGEADGSTTDKQGSHHHAALF